MSPIVVYTAYLAGLISGAILTIAVAVVINEAYDLQPSAAIRCAECARGEVLRPTESEMVGGEWEQ